MHHPALSRKSLKDKQDDKPLIYCDSRKVIKLKSAYDQDFVVWVGVSQENQMRRD